MQDTEHRSSILTRATINFKMIIKMQKIYHQKASLSTTTLTSGLCHVWILNLWLIPRNLWKSRMSREVGVHGQNGLLSRTLRTRITKLQNHGSLRIFPDQRDCRFLLKKQPHQPSKLTGSYRERQGMHHGRRLRVRGSGNSLGGF